MLLGEVILKKRRENILHLLLGPIWNKKKISALYLEETKKDAKNVALRHLLTVKVKIWNVRLQFQEKRPAPQHCLLAV